MHMGGFPTLELGKTNGGAMDFPLQRECAVDLEAGHYPACANGIVKQAIHQSSPIHANSIRDH